ncbi:MAG: hypothetical protein HY868_03305 [Chloroflexi bacterium]|nr:hypothetical protein [Chloroflexota bacterium]
MRRQFPLTLLSILLVLLLAVAGQPTTAASTAGDGRIRGISTSQAAPTFLLQSTFGDLNTQFNGGNSIDAFKTYHPPHKFITWTENSAPPNTTPGTGPRPLRNSDERTGGNFPFILTGHQRFDPLKVISATLRVDLLFNAAGGTVASDTLRFWDERDTTGNYSIGYALGSRVAHRFCSPFGDKCTSASFPPTWISLDLNLKDGTARVFDLDPVTLQRTPFSPRPGGAASGCNAQVPVDCPWPFNPELLPFDRGSPADVLRLAADGALYGLLEDDSALSFVSLTVQVEAPPVVCPTVLDDFTRANGALGVNWGGEKSLSNYRLVNQRLNVNQGGPIYWTRDIFGASQVACVTLTKVDPRGKHQSLLLKVQGIWQQGAVAVFYDATAHRIGIETFIPGRGWETQTTIPNIQLQDGDQLGARVRDGNVGGNVDVYRNGVRIKETSLHPFFNGKRGRIGLWFIDSSNTVLDDFAGGTVAP